MEALVISLMCEIACPCSRRLRAAEQSAGTNRPKFRILASWAVQTMQLFVARPVRIRMSRPDIAAEFQGASERTPSASA